MTQLDTNGSDRPVVVLFRHDLRVSDNGALSAAARTGKPVIPVFILDETAGRPRGAACRWWLHHSLKELDTAIRSLGSVLLLKSGESTSIVEQLVEQTGADLVFWNRRYDPPAVGSDRRLKEALSRKGIQSRSFDGQLLHEPWKVETTSGGPFRVYTPFSRAVLSGPSPRAPHAAPHRLRGFVHSVTGERLVDWHLRPEKPDWAVGIAKTWRPGEIAANEMLNRFLERGLNGYSLDRDRPDLEGTSRLSPHLAHGEITPFQIFHALSAREFEANGRDVEKFRRELVWREFCWHLLFHHQDLHRRNYNPRFDAFPWLTGSDSLKRWQMGLTGYPFIDAGMRQLWQTGWMHNRTRMATASFLAKHLLVDWRAGEAWFWDTLVDADPANNPASWQWVAGSGADAAPYFRVFNPVLQGEKFDPDASYIRSFVPELGRLSGPDIHRLPTLAGKERQSVLAEHSIDYPTPVVEHGAARRRALQAFEMTRPD